MLPDILVVYDDSGGSERVSRSENGQILNDWLKSNRHLFSDKGYYAYRGSYLSKHISQTQPLQTLKDLVLGYFKGGMTIRLVLRRALRAYFPTIYSFLVTFLLRSKDLFSHKH